MKRFLKIPGFSLIGIIIAFLFNYLLLERLIIPNPCYYHSHNTTKVFDLFYKLTASEGYHPTPTIFNLTITLITGALTGLLFGLKFTNKKQKLKIQHHTIK